jgi:hypothetical protein
MEGMQNKLTNLQIELLKTFTLQLNDNELEEVKNYLCQRFSGKFHDKTYDTDNSLTEDEIRNFVINEKNFPYLASEKSLAKDWMTEENKVWDNL